jgi:hypothetical protein
MSREAVPASRTQVLENDNVIYLYVRSRNYALHGSPCVTTQVLDEDDETYVYLKGMFQEINNFLKVLKIKSVFSTFCTCADSFLSFLLPCYGENKRLSFGLLL